MMLLQNVIARLLTDIFKSIMWKSLMALKKVGLSLKRYYVIVYFCEKTCLYILRPKYCKPYMPLKSVS